MFRYAIQIYPDRESNNDVVFFDSLVIDYNIIMIEVLDAFLPGEEEIIKSHWSNGSLCCWGIGIKYCTTVVFKHKVQ
jgi:hypothetical protein